LSCLLSTRQLLHYYQVMHENSRYISYELTVVSFEKRRVMGYYRVFNRATSMIKRPTRPVYTHYYQRFNRLSITSANGFK
jgi:hypothetical protein